MDFTIEQRLAGPPDAVEAVLLDPAFVTARAELPKLGGAELVESRRDGDHARQRIRLHFTGDLAPAVTAVIDRDKLTWVDDASYDLATHVAEHRVLPEHYPDRLACSYTTTISPDGTGSRRVMQGRVRVRMVLVGGKVEAAIVSGLCDYASAETALIDSWLARAR